VSSGALFEFISRMIFRPLSAALVFFSLIISQALFSGPSGLIGVFPSVQRCLFTRAVRVLVLSLA